LDLREKERYPTPFDKLRTGRDAKIAEVKNNGNFINIDLS
jgi:hypothetical protein